MPVSSTSAQNSPSWSASAGLGALVPFGQGSAAFALRLEATPPLVLDLPADLDLTVVVGALAAFTSSSYSIPNFFTGSNQSISVSTWAVEIAPAARLAWRGATEERRLAVYFDLGVGLSWTFARTTTDVAFMGPQFSSTDGGSAVFRLALGASWLLTDSVVLQLEPLGLNLYSRGGPAVYSALLGAGVRF